MNAEARFRADPTLWHDVQEFLHYEADVLDNRNFEEWLTLLTDDIRYWMPLAYNVRRDDMAREYSREQADVAWFDEGLETLRQRVAQLRTGMHWAEEPASRVTHLISNIRIVEAGPDPASPETVKVRCRFIVYQNRLQTEQSWFVGKRVDALRRSQDSWKIARREIYLDQNVLLPKALTVFF